MGRASVEVETTTRRKKDRRRKKDVERYVENIGEYGRRRPASWRAS